MSSSPRTVNQLPLLPHIYSNYQYFPLIGTLSESEGMVNAVKRKTNHTWFLAVRSPCHLPLPCPPPPSPAHPEGSKPPGAQAAGTWPALLSVPELLQDKEHFSSPMTSFWARHGLLGSSLLPHSSKQANQQSVPHWVKDLTANPTVETDGRRPQ